MAETIYMEPTIALMARTDRPALEKLEGVIKATKDGVKYIVVKDEQTPQQNEQNDIEPPTQIPPSVQDKESTV